MRLSPRALNRATLGRQLLLERESLSVEEGVRRVVALQAQHPASPYLALWNRLAGFDPAELDAAFAAYRVVKATSLRVTLHAVHVDDYRDFREAMDPTLIGARLRDRRFTTSGLSAGGAHALIPELLGFAEEPRSAAAYEAWLDRRLGDRAHRGVWWALRQYAPLWHAPAGGPWAFGSRPAYVAAGPRPTLADAEAAATGLQALIKRYLAGFGPASLPDMAQFALVLRPRVRAALEALAGELDVLEGPSGETLYDLPGAPRPPEETPAPSRLLGMWDNVLLAHADRGRVIPPAYRKHVTRSNGDVLPTLLVDGSVAGVWRPVEGGIEATAFHSLPADVWQALAAEARSLLALLAAREPDVYRRYNRWWTDLPRAEVRLLPG